MRTGCSLTVCRSLLLGGYLVPGGVLSPRGVLSPGGVPSPGGCVSDPGGVWPGGCLTWGVYLVPGGVLSPGGVPSPGVCVSDLGGIWPGGVVCLRHAPTPGQTQPLPPVNRILDTRLWKYYLGHNFVAAGNDRSNTLFIYYNRDGE